MNSSRTTSRTRLVPQGSVNVNDLRISLLQTRSNFTRVRAGAHRLGNSTGPKPDFITFVSLACEIYQAQDHDLVPVAHYSSILETAQGKGHTSLVTQARLALEAPSTLARGTVGSYHDRIIIKRPRHSILEDKADSLVSFITELRVRSHTALRSHPNITRLRGIGWDFEDEDGTIPRPILLEELAPQGALDNFWRNWSIVRLGFKAKLDFCHDIADGLLALHACGVVHGDVKPENILVFPRRDARDSFILKLTDFGHSVIEADGARSLPAFTLQWSAPETTRKSAMTFAEMRATDCYSYGLVLLSIMLGRAFHTAMEDVEQCKQDGSIFLKFIELVEKEDRYSDDSDLEVGTIVLLLNKSAQLNPQARSLEACVSIIDTYQLENQLSDVRSSTSVTKPLPVPVPALEVVAKVTVGYRTLLQCSHHLKARIASTLEDIARQPKDPRCAAAAWELVVCYFSGFGVARDFDAAGRWLALAHEQGIVAAQDFFEPLQGAIEVAKEVKSHYEMDFARRQKAYAEKAEKAKTMCDEKHAEMTRSTAENASAAAEEGRAHLAVNQEDAGEKKAEESNTKHPAPDPSMAKDIESRANNGPLAPLHPHNAAASFRRYLDQETKSLDSAFKPMSAAVKNAVTTGSLDDLQDLLSRDPESANAVDETGNTPLLLSLDFKQFRVLQYLLSLPSVTADVHNKSGQTPLHFLADFDDEDAIPLISQLIAKGADVLHEALPTQSNKNRFVLSLGVRCCPMLNAVLHDKVAFLSALLEAVHMESQEAVCQICEAGSRFRRILAVSLSLFRIDALQLLTGHLRACGRYQTVELANIKVWAGQNLLELYQAPFHSVAVSAMDLPESFFRALIYGRAHAEVLERTINFLLAVEGDGAKSTASHRGRMLQAACAGGSLDGANYLLAKMAEAQEEPLKLYQLREPLETAIQHGTRDIFSRLVQEDSAFMDVTYDAVCQLKQCREPKYHNHWRRIGHTLLGEDAMSYLPPGHTHPEHLVHSLLNFSISVRHQDSFFTSIIMGLCGPNLLLRNGSDRAVRSRNIRLAGSLDRAVRTSNFKAAAILLENTPDALMGRVFIEPGQEGFAYDFDRVCNDGSFSLYSHPRRIIWTVSTRVLSIGSYQQCKFVLTHLLMRRRMNGQELLSRNRWKRLGGDCGLLPSKEIRGGHPARHESGVPSWQRCPLLPEEYDALLTGNILRNSADRQVLWNVIDAQVAAGHPRDVKYLHMAIDATNLEALIKLLDRGWPVNGAWSHYFSKPLGRTSRRWINMDDQPSRYSWKFLRPNNQHLLSLMELHGVEGPPALEGPHLETHSSIYHAYKVSRLAYVQDLYNTKMGEVAAILHERGGRFSPFTSLSGDIRLAGGMRRRIVEVWAIVVHALLYAVILPPALAYGARGSLDDMTWGQRFGFAYLWSLLCYVLPFLGTVRLAREFIATRSQLIWLFMCAMIWAFNHVGLPFLVIAYGWRPLGSCKYFVEAGQLGSTCVDYSFLLPLVAMFVQALSLIGLNAVLDEFD